MNWYNSDFNILSYCTFLNVLVCWILFWGFALMVKAVDISAHNMFTLCSVSKGSFPQFWVNWTFTQKVYFHQYPYLQVSLFRFFVFVFFLADFSYWRPLCALQRAFASTWKTRGESHWGPGHLWEFTVLLGTSCIRGRGTMIVRFWYELVEGNGSDFRLKSLKYLLVFFIVYDIYDTLVEVAINLSL